MATKAGVWIDHKQATVVLITDAGQEIRKIVSGDEKPVRPLGGPKKKFTPNDFIAEDRRERKVAGERKIYFDAVLASMRDATSLLILGPGEAKGELNKHIQSKKLRGVSVELETSDRITDRQLAAKVGGHFAQPAASKSVVAKVTTKVVSRKRAKKAGK